MARDYQIRIALDDEKRKRVEEAGLSGYITQTGDNREIIVILPIKNQRKFRKAFPDAVFNDQTGEVDTFPEDAAAMLFDTVIEHKTLEVMHLFLLKAFNPLAGRKPRQKVH
ncbi:MAG: hypothetical protein DRG87_13000 [Deltaproteobacteria bacterium]|nr:hypothetical protein [Deltaproteobacteria bacterium]RLB26399.1 MAG: hypothetical protein DRG87_13000 [Deltaproteobacteria bacterium]